MLLQTFGQGAEPISSNPDAQLAPGTSSHMDGVYYVVTNPSLANPAWHNGPDHTTGAGYMALFNANYQSPYYRISSPVEVPGATYRASYWTANAIRYDADPVYSDGYIGLTVEDQASGGTILATGPGNSTPLARAATAGPLAWVERAVSFQLPINYAASEIYLNFVNTTPLVPQGNDIVVDDIRVEMATARISGRIYVDNNTNGVFDAGDGTLSASLPYVAVVDANNAVMDFVQIAADGTYLLANAAYSTSDIGQKVILLNSAPSLGQVVAAATVPSGYELVSETPNPTYGTTGALPLDGILNVVRADSATGDHPDFNIGLQLVEADLSISKDDGQTQYTPGGTVNYTIVVGNDGPSDVTGAQVSDPLPAGISTASWTCSAAGGGTCGAASGTGGISTTADLPAGTSVTYTLSMIVPIGFGGNLTNTATVTAPAGVTEANSANNSASDTDTQFTSPPGPGPGACNIANNGSFESPNIQTEPQRTGENTAYVNGYAIWRTTTYPIDGWQTVSGTVDFLRHFNNASHGTQSIDLFGTAAATFRQTFTGLVPGQSYSFSIDYSGMLTTNAGLVQLGNGAGVTPVTLATLRPAADAISNGNAGIPNTPAYSVTWSTFRYTFIAAGTEATIQFVETGAGTTGLFIDNFIFAGDAPCEADLSITKDDGVATYTPGLDTSYTIVVSNNGPGPVGAAQISDPLPAGITNASWTCGNATGGGVCGAASGTGAISTTANLPVGGSVTYTLTMGIPESYSGNLTNTATVTAPTGVTEIDAGNNTASDTDTLAPPPTSGACSPVRNLGGAFNPFGVNVSMTRTGTWQPNTYWTTFGSNYSITWTFSQPIPANWIQFAVFDVGGGATYPATLPSIRVTLGAGGTATPADFSLIPGWSSLMNDLTYTASTGALGYVRPNDGRKAAGALRGNSADTVKSITITGTNIEAGDYIVNTLYARPSCLTVAKVSEDGTGSFQIDMSNVVQDSGTTVPGVTLATTTAGTPVSSSPYKSIPGTAITLSEVVPAGWNLASAVCTDQNAANTGNPTVVGGFTSPAMTIPAANVRPESDLQCVFTNELAAPALTIEKTGTLNDTDGDGLIDLGETISYSFRVENTGGTELIGVTVNDQLLVDAGVAVSPGAQTLAPGGTATFTATYTPTQADIDAGQVSNTAIGTGTPPSGTPIDSPPDTAVVPPDDTPGLTIEKTGTLNDSDGDGLIDLGETISYSFLATNTGTVTLTGVTVIDPLLDAAGISVSPGPQTLAPRGTATFTATYTPTQADIDAGQVTNTATGTGTPPSGPPIDSPPDTVTVPPDQASGLTIEKTGTLNDLDGDDLIDLGETISYSFLVRNTGAVTLTNVTVTDPLVTVDQTPQTLAPAASFTFTATYTPTQADIDAGQVTNTATGTGTPPSGPPVDSPPDTAVVPPDDTPGLTIDKTGTLNDADGDGLIDLGETISYSFLATNTGGVTLTGVTIIDPLLDNAGIAVSPGAQTLAPGGTATFTATYTPTQADIDAGQVSNTATGTGTPPSGPPIDSPPDTSVVPPDQAPALVIEKTGTLNDLDGDDLIDLNETISYSFRVENTGTVTMTGVTVNDQLLVNAGISVSPGPQTLAPRGTTTFTATYTPTQADIDAGRVENTATGTGTPPSGPPIDSPPDTVIVPPDQTSGLTIDKTGTLNDGDGDGLIDPGETITYTFLAENTGTVTLTGVTVNDPLLGNAGISVTPGPQTLAPGGTATFTATYTPTQADIDAGRVENTATGTGIDPDGGTTESPPDTVTVPPDQTPRLIIEKEGTLNDADGDGLLDTGETITYTFLAQNTGAVTLTGVTVNDPLLTTAGISVTPGPQTLAPGGTVTFTAEYTPTQAQIDTGRVENTATGTGTPPSGPPIESPPDTVTVPPQPASLTLLKTGRFEDADGNGRANPGDTLTYNLTVTNDGGQTVVDAWPQDPGPTFNGKAAAGSLSAFAPGPVTLFPGQHADFTASYTLTETDIVNAAGIEDGVENTATAIGYVNGNVVTGTPVESQQSTVTVALPAAALGDIAIAKVAFLRHIRRGEEAPFAITISNLSPTAATGLTVIDTLPSGFRFVEGSASIDGVAATPVVEGLRVIFENVTVPANSQIEIRLRMLALSSAGPGEHVNRASVTDTSGNPLAPEATASVEILVEPVFDCGDIIGRVFDDQNRNGYQDQGELGLPGVRIATVNGWLVTTDAHGRFHVACAALPDQRIGSNFIMKVDTRTLPTGYRLTTENPRVVRLTAGKMTELNFGASIGRVVRLDLQDAAFEPGRIELREQWAEGLDQLIAFLAEEQSVLRLTYLEPGGNLELAEERLEHLSELIGERWRQTSGQYRLEIEMRVETGK
ncbi:DUF7507 domain-containing protein [Devosia nitrariae]|uniref:DUF11 domain-containing protein n=1 Tax=Devosia nitrariae TaxID=2071872 RepID=A0ABQ5W6F0_9HYPH|nr:hypothetical protein [Devosia nitrariae]GLQ55500.1 hypothetical protein GCM10010862_27590 [Devosia nitrariae]